MERYARTKGVQIRTSSRVTELPDTGKVIVATSLEAARSLFDDDSLRWESGRAALLDIGLKHDRRDPFAVFDFDEGGMIERFSSQDPTLAPRGHQLIQGQIPLRKGESKTTGLNRLESLYDLAFPEWRDRPSVARGDGRYLIGDMVAAPGLLAEVSINSALAASDLVTAAE
jgi:hypothetical protein